MGHEIIRGDVGEVLPKLPPDYYSACLCDPPYHLTSGDSSKGFMDAKWDGGDVAFRKETWEKVKRVLKPGAFMMAFGGTRTFHRLVCAIEDSGMDVRDMLVWLYATGKPPSYDISKGIDKAKGAERKVIGKYRPPAMSKDWNLANATDGRTVKTFASSRNNLDVTAPATQEAKLFDGYGTCLSPSYEPISVSMKPTEGGFVANALSFMVAGLNIDAGRIPVVDGEELKGGSGGRLSHVRDGKPYGEDNGYVQSSLGRWPKNVVFDEEAMAMLAERAAGAERFFYCAKPSTVERNLGLGMGKNAHPTVKPLGLLRYLCLLMLPPKVDGVKRRIIVPFSGSGSEMIAAIAAGFDEVVGIENGGGDEKVAKENIDTANRRLAYWSARLEEEGRTIFD